MNGIKAVYRLGLRQLAGRHRLGMLIALALTAALPALIAALVRAYADFPENEWERLSHGLMASFVSAFVVPVLALIPAGQVIREELQTQTLQYLWIRPIARATIVLGKLLSAYTVTLLPVWVSVLATAVWFTSSPSFLLLQLLVSTIAVVAYTAWFLALSMILDRALLWGFVYLLVWEGALGQVSSAVSALTLKRYVLSIATALTTDSQPEVALSTGLLVLGAATAVFIALAIVRLQRMEFPGTTES